VNPVFRGLALGSYSMLALVLLRSRVSQCTERKRINKQMVYLILEQMKRSRQDIEWPRAGQAHQRKMSCIIMPNALNRNDIYYTRASRVFEI
jgi:hypothetical protein